MPDDTPAASAPALGFSITANIHDRSQIVAQSFVPFEASDDQINAALDKVMKALDRQAAKYQIKDLKRKMEFEDIALKNQVEKVADFQNAAAAEFAASGRRGEFKLSKQQEVGLENHRKTIDGMKYNVERYRVNIAELEARIG
jgi:hypothetical protein